LYPILTVVFFFFIEKKKRSSLKDFPERLNK